MVDAACDDPPSIDQAGRNRFREPTWMGKYKRKVEPATRVPEGLKMVGLPFTRSSYVKTLFVLILITLKSSLARVPALLDILAMMSSAFALFT